MSHHPKPGKPPSRWQLKQMAMDGQASATDGCRVDLTATCEHGHPSWLIRLGVLSVAHASPATQETPVKPTAQP